MKGVGSKSMNTETSFISQLSESILRQILLKNFYNLRHAIQKYDYWHDLSEFVQTFLSPSSLGEKITKIIISSLLVKGNMPCTAQFYSLRKDWKSDNVTRVACSYFLS